MQYDEEKVDEAVLALLQGFISDPKNKNKSIVLSEEGARRSAELFTKFFDPRR